MKTKGTNDERLHIVPINDLRPHKTSMDCWCKPKRDEEESNVIIHNSMDKREEYERDERAMS